MIPPLGLGVIGREPLKTRCYVAARGGKCERMELVAQPEQKALLFDGSSPAVGLCLELAEHSSCGGRDQGLTRRFMAFVVA